MAGVHVFVALSAVVNMLQADLARKFKLSPNRLVFKNLVAGRSVDRFPLPAAGKILCDKMGHKRLGVLRCAIAMEACGVRCVFWARSVTASATPPRASAITPRASAITPRASAITPRARGPPHATLTLGASSRHAEVSEWTCLDCVMSQCPC